MNDEKRDEQPKEPPPEVVLEVQDSHHPSEVKTNG